MKLLYRIPFGMKKRMEMDFNFDKRGLMKSNAFHFALILVFAVAIVFVMNFAGANPINFWSLDSAVGNLTINFTKATGVNVNEDTNFTFNISLNKSSGTTIHVINVTLWKNFLFTNGTNNTGMNLSVYGEGSLATSENLSITFRNTSDGDQLTWRNMTANSAVVPGNGTWSNVTLSFNLTALTPGLYNITIRTFNGTGGAASLPLSGYNETNITIRVNDTTKPHNVSIVDTNLNRGWVNMSDSFTLNLSVLDNGNFSLGNDIYTEISEVNITIYNASSVVNASYNMSNVTKHSSFGNYWNITINTNNFPDGIYNISIKAKDRNGNVNNTNISNVRIDNTNPTATVSCSPGSVNLGNTVTCTCSPSDSLSGVNSSATAITTNPSTVNTGTLTETCSFGDMAGNTATASGTYTVEQGGSAATTGGGAGTSGATTLPPHTFSKVTPGEPSVKEYTDPDLGLKEIQINVNSEAQNVKISVIKYDSKPAQVSIEKAGKAYQYLQINVDNVENKLSKATISTKVKKTWVSDNKLIKDDVFVFKFDETQGKWNELITTYKSEDDTYYYYDAEVTSFSYFAIGEKVLIDENGEEVGVSEGAGEEIAKERNLTWLWVVIAVIVIVAIAGIVLKKRSEN